MLCSCEYLTAPPAAPLRYLFDRFDELQSGFSQARGKDAMPSRAQKSSAPVLRDVRRASVESARARIGPPSPLPAARWQSKIGRESTEPRYSSMIFWQCFEHMLVDHLVRWGSTHSINSMAPIVCTKNGDATVSRRRSCSQLPGRSRYRARTHFDASSPRARQLSNPLLK
jgi:hypothetical protein